ncbi:MAG: SGNH hydrolase domain-containing protein, partial [Solirubrobacteraceae bacterium]
CYGAAARDPEHACANRTRAVTPSLREARRLPGSPCTPDKYRREPQVCRFGVPAGQARGSVALVGDSHALHWRAALEVVARAKRWQGFSLTSVGCLFSAATRALGEPALSICRRWNRSVQAWFRRHPEVSTVFVSHYAVPMVVVAPGRKTLAVQLAGLRRAWGALPKTVKHLVVVRDIPSSTDAAFECVRDVIAAHNRRAGLACAVRRPDAVAWDSSVSAVLRLRSGRYRYVDLTDFFCSRHYCYPVIGGVRVYRDVDHMTVAYSTTLGPYLLRAVDRLMASW